MDGALVLSQQKPQNEAFSGILPLNGMGYAKAEEDCRTPLAGLFVAGDTRAKPYRGLFSALSDGRAAAESALLYLSASFALYQYF